MAEEQSPIDKIDEKLNENQMNLLSMQNFLESKRIEIYELQNFLIKEFQNIEGWNDQKDKIILLVKKDIKNVLADMKNLFTNFVEQAHEIAYQIVSQVIKTYQIKFHQQQKDIQGYSHKIKEQSIQIQNLKLKIERNSESFSLLNLKRMDCDRSQKRNTQLSKSLSKSSFLDFHINRLKSRDKPKEMTPKSYKLSNEKEQIGVQKSCFMDRNEKCLRSFKNFCEQENKLERSPVKRITYEVRLEKEDKGQMEHKRYVKQKIQCLKSKNSGIFNEHRPLKAERRF